MAIKYKRRNEEGKKIIPPIFDSIKNERPWIFIGYSGEDPIFEHIERLGRFDNGLYWVSYNDHEPVGRVKEFLEKPNMNTCLVKGYDADSFMLKLNSELGLQQPEIIDKPFSALKKSLDQIVDIDDEEHFKAVKERLEIAKKQVNKAIQQFEVGDIQSPEKILDESKTDLLKKEIINLIVNENYPEDEIREIEDKAEESGNIEISSLLASLYFNWAVDLGDLAATKSGKEVETLYQQAFKKHARAITIKPDDHEALNNWGTDLGDLAATKSGAEAETLYKQAFEKYARAIEIKPDKHEAFYNWGNDLGRLAGTKSGAEAETLYQQAFEKYTRAIEIKPDMHEALNNWGNDLGRLATTKSGAEALYQQAFEKYARAIEIKPDKYEAFNNWGNALIHLAKTKSGTEAESLYQQAFEKLNHAVLLGGGYYKLACVYAMKEDKDNALLYLDKSLENKEITPGFVLKGEDWRGYLEDDGFQEIINRHQGS